MNRATWYTREEEDCSMAGIREGQALLTCTCLSPFLRPCRAQECSRDKQPGSLELTLTSLFSQLAYAFSIYIFIVGSNRKVDSSSCSYMRIANTKTGTDLGYIRINIQNSITGLSMI